MLKITTTNRIMHAVATDNSRYQLRSPAVRIKDGKVHIMATDGRIAAVRPVETIEGDASGDELKILPEDTIRKASKHTKPIDIQLDASEARVQHVKRTGALDGPETVGSYIDPTDRPFAPISDICPRESSTRRYVAIAVNPDLLHQAMKAAQSEREDERGVVLFVPFAADKSGTLLEDTEVIQPAGLQPMLIAGGEKAGGASVCMPVGMSLGYGSARVGFLERVRGLFAAVAPPRPSSP